MNENLLNVLVCPVCRGSLLYNKDQQELICRIDKLAYPIKNEIPVMMANKARKLSLEDIHSIQH